jgi:hypothetical protein
MVSAISVSVADAPVARCGHGSLAGSLWSWLTRWLAVVMAHSLARCDAQNKYGKPCARIVRLLLDKKQMEEKFVRTPS